MMTWNDKHRPYAREMLRHEWVREGGVAGDNVLEPEVLQRLRSFAGMNRLKKHALLVSVLAGAEGVWWLCGTCWGAQCGVGRVCGVEHLAGRVKWCGTCTCAA